MMNKGLIRLAVLPAGFLLLASCAAPQRRDGVSPGEGSAFSLEKAYDSGYWVTRPSAAGITVIGIAGRRVNRDEAVREARADAARKAALYHGVRGESSLILDQGPGNLDYYSDLEYQLDLLNSAEQYIDSLVFDKDRDVFEKNGSIFVRFQYPVVSDVPSYNMPLEDGIPAWVKQYNADIPGFLTIVGQARNKGSLQKTFQASYENAVVSLLPRLSSAVSSGVVDTEGNRGVRNTSTGSGVLEKVVILETWLDTKTNSVWTLLVAKQKK
jgi:hypothetical protein